MKCPKCGKEMPPYAQYCDNCGKKLKNQNYLKHLMAVIRSHQKAVKITAAVIAAVGLISLTAYSIYQSSFMNVTLITDALDITMYGGNENAIAVVKSAGSDFKGIQEKYPDLQLVYSDEDEKPDREQLTEDQAAILDFVDSISYSIQYPDGKARGNLATGDVITIAASYDQEMAEKAGIKVNGTEYQYTVPELPKQTPLDLFDGMELEWDADYSDSSAHVVIASDHWEKYKGIASYQIGYDEHTGIANVSAVIIDDNYCAKNYVYDKDFVMGSTPISLSIYADGAAEKLSQEAERLAEEYTKRCTTVYRSGNPLKITGYDVEPDGKEDYTATFQLSDGNSFTMELRPNLFKSKDGTIRQLGDYDFGEEACII